MTRNEFYAEVGLDGIGPAGEVYLQPLAVQLTPKKQTIDTRDDDESGELDPVEQADSFDEEEESESDREEEDEEEEGKSNGRAKLLKVAANAPDDDDRREHEKGLNVSLTGYFEDMQEDLEEELEQQYGS